VREASTNIQLFTANAAHSPTFMRQEAEAVRTWKIQVQQQQIGVRMLIEGVKQSGHTVDVTR
jgi:hypothetical protein